MALKALDIYKYLPKTNCGKCGYPTCLAFSMQMAAKKANLADCPEVTEEARAALEGASSPPIRLVTIGVGDKAIQIGNETVLFRHDETFYHPTGIAVRISDDEKDGKLEAEIKAVKALSFERVGQRIAVDMVAVHNTSGSKANFVEVVEAVGETGLALILMSKDIDTLAAALDVCGARRPLLYKADAGNWEQMAELALKYGVPIVLDASNLAEAADLTPKLNKVGVHDIVLDVTANGLAETLSALTKVRRLALRKGFRPLGYPCMAIPSSLDPDLAALEAATYVTKYAAITIVDSKEPWRILPILTVRQNIFTDPRKPVQVEPKVYEVGAVNDKSPLLVTTNFSLTYYTVESDVEASRVPAYIAVVDTEGTSVLTAWASEKLTVDKVARLLNSQEVQSKVSHRKVIIPGYVSVMSGKLEDESGWKVLVGPRESSGIPKYLKTMWKAD
ncbi:MAG: acetyl-CoA decarbonylase/synthase complex subunit gamma [Armatimonadota bacterium]|nr:acetyl-CoA decarbonylase/synthase complex subunit gamma [Armatimonadota bacterium]